MTKVRWSCFRKRKKTHICKSFVKWILIESWKWSKLFAGSIGVSQLRETPLGSDIWWICHSLALAIPTRDFNISRFLSGFLVSKGSRRTHKANKDIKMMDLVHLIPERDRVIFQRERSGGGGGGSGGGWDMATTLNVNSIIDPPPPPCYNFASCYFRHVAVVFLFCKDCQNPRRLLLKLRKQHVLCDTSFRIMANKRRHTKWSAV